MFRVLRFGGSEAVVMCWHAIMRRRANWGAIARRERRLTGINIADTITFDSFRSTTFQDAVRVISPATL